MALRDRVAVEFPDAFVPDEVTESTPITLALEDQGDGTVLAHLKGEEGTTSIELAELEEAIAFLAGRLVAARK